MFRLLAIHGKARVGKDTVAGHLVNEYGYMRNAFADPLKRAAQQMFMLTDEQTMNDEYKESVIPYWGMSPRQMFQLLGTEGGRNIFGDDIWLKRWRYHYDAYGPHTNYVVPDARFQNEIDYIHALGGTVIHIVRDAPLIALQGNTAKHASEGSVVVGPSDFVVENNGTKKQLFAKIDAVIAVIEGSHV